QREKLRMIEQTKRRGGKYVASNDPFTKASARTNIRRLHTVGNPDGRNKRTVWNINTGSFHGAHFATFPPRLVEPCILAGTSQKGCCPACGSPYMCGEEWTPGCDCDAGAPIPCTVLDIFNGAATTGLAALKNGRNYIGIELKPEYVEISRQRIEKALKAA
ncbi:MAG TPA: DNA methyltransferase, partial [Blastocatellia bacterium]|nr:DNA methyltransferase [Blastocatellia bacterium]